MLVNEIIHYFNPEQLNSYDISWTKADQSFKVISGVYADSEYAGHLFKESRKWLNLGIADDKGNTQYYSMTLDKDTIYVFLRSGQHNYHSSDIKEFSSFEAAQEFVAKHIRTKASHIEGAQYKVADEANLINLDNMIKNLNDEPFYI